MLDKDSLRRLRCPVSLSPLTQADDALLARVNDCLETRGLPTRGGQLRRETVAGGLLTDDRGHLYPIEDGIVCMLADSAIELELLNEAAG